MKPIYDFDAESVPYWISTLYWGVYVTIFVFAAWRLLTATSRDRKKDFTGWFSLFFAAYAIFFCINPDYFRYRSWMNVTILDKDIWEDEKLYFYLVLFCKSLHFDYPFELFRLIVWGGAIFVFWRLCRLYRGLLLPGLSLLLLFIFFAETFSYARASLAMAIYFSGIALYLTHDKRRLKLLGLVIALSSMFFHREMMVGIAVLPCLFIPLEKKSYIPIAAIMLLVVIVIISYASSNPLFLNSLFDDEDMATKVENINGKELGRFRLSTFFSYFKYFYPFCLITKYLWKKKVPRSVTGLYRIMCGILMVSVAFMVVVGLRSIYTYRILYIMMIPTTIMISYGYYRGYFTKRQVFIMLLIALLTNSKRFINT